MQIRSRAWPLVGLGLAAVVLAYALVALSVGEKGPGVFEPEGVDIAQRTYGGILQEGNRLGPDDAEVTVSVFVDLQCPSCAAWYEDNIVDFVERNVRTGEVAAELRHFAVGPVPRTRAAFGAVAAGEQGDQWQFAHVFMANIDQVPQQGVDDEYLEQIASAVPGQRFDLEQWREDLDSPEVEEVVNADSELSTSLRLPAEPAVIVDGPGGTVTLEDSPSLEQIEAAISEASG